MVEAVASRGHERALTVHGRRVQLFEGGAGRPLLYLHGAGTFWWMPVHDLLAARRRILLPVHPGFGAPRGSTRSRRWRTWSFTRSTCWTPSALDRVDVVGLSLGGWLAAELALRHPARVRRPGAGRRGGRAACPACRWATRSCCRRRRCGSSCSTTPRRRSPRRSCPTRRRRSGSRRAARARGGGPAPVEPGPAVPEAHEPALAHRRADARRVGPRGPADPARLRRGVRARHPGRAARDPGPLRPPPALRAPRALRRATSLGFRMERRRARPQ